MNGEYCCWDRLIIMMVFSGFFGESVYDVVGGLFLVGEWFFE